MSELVRIVFEDAPGVVIARLTGEIDSSNAARVQRRLLEAVGNAGAGLVADLTGTRYIDSAGIRILFDTGERLRVRGMELRLVAEPETFTADVLRTVRMDERFSVDATTKSAVDSILERQPRERTLE